MQGSRDPVLPHGPRLTGLFTCGVMLVFKKYQIISLEIPGRRRELCSAQTYPVSCLLLGQHALTEQCGGGKVHLALSSRSQSVAAGRVKSET